MGSYAPQEIIYLCVPFREIESNGLPYVFTDGHAYSKLTSFYQRKEDLGELDWEIILSSEWRNTEDDPDRKRRKQAELLVKGEVPVHCIRHIVVYDRATAKKVKALVSESNFPHIEVWTNPTNGRFYKRFYF